VGCGLLPVISCQLCAVGYGLWAVGCAGLAVDCGLWGVGASFGLSRTRTRRQLSGGLGLGVGVEVLGVPFVAACA
jgi:hypothetical protein